MSFEKRVANRKWFAENVEAGDSVSFVYNGLQRFGEVVESVRRRQPNDSSTSVRGWLTLEMTVPLQDREDVNGKVPSKFKRFNWNNMSRCEKYWTLNCGWKSQGENKMKLSQPDTIIIMSALRDKAEAVQKQIGKYPDEEFWTERLAQVKSAYKGFTERDLE